MYTESIQNWLTYALALGTNAAACALIKDYRTPSAALAVGLDELQNLGRLSPEGARRLARPDERKAGEIMALCREFDWRILTPDAPGYPKRLLSLSDFPLVLFAAGETGLLDAPDCAAVVGTRKASERGLDYAFRLAACFSENGVVTVSGCATGIDTAAHEGGLTGIGSTVAVLGNGFGYNYLPDQVFLRRRIRKYGLLLSETLPFQGPAPYSFQRRNRIISALAGGVVVVESGKTGGSLITAGCARRQGRPLFVPPPAVLDSPGCRRLLGTGARPLETPADILPDPARRGLFLPPAAALETPRPLPDFLDPAASSLSSFALHSEATLAEAAPVHRQIVGRGARPVRAQAAPPPQDDLFSRAEQAAPAPAEEPVPQEKAENDAPPGLSDVEAAAFNALSRQPVLMDELTAGLGLPAAEVMNAVSLLELRGLVRTLPGNRVARAGGGK